jgi:CRP-like cAMP-binding protein
MSTSVEFGPTAFDFSSIYERPVETPNFEMSCLQRAGTPLKFRRREPLYSEGEKGQFVYLVEDGIIRVSRSGESGQRQVLAFRVSGDVFGFPEREVYVNSAEAVTEARLSRISWPRLQQMMLEDPELHFTLFTKIMRDFRQAQSRIVMLGQQNTCQRLATFLLELMDIPHFYDAKNSLLNIPINRFDLADFLGTAPETAARAFAKLESRGLVRRTTSRVIRIVDPPGLRVMRRGPRRGARIESPVPEDA